MILVQNNEDSHIYTEGYTWEVDGFGSLIIFDKNKALVAEHKRHTWEIVSYSEGKTDIGSVISNPSNP